MVFITEELTKEDKTFFSSFGFLDIFQGNKGVMADIPSSWVSDRENDIYLVCLGGQGEKYDKEFPPNYYRLIINNFVIKINAMHKNTGDNKMGIHTIWKILSIDVPQGLSNILADELHEIIKKAFIREAYRGYGKRIKNVKSVNFAEFASVYYRKGDLEC